MERLNKKIICALDTSDLAEAISIVQRLSPHVGAFKIGHALTLNFGLDVVSRLQDVGAHRIFLDLKFHDIPNSVALAVRQAARRGVWMMTLHIAGGPAMLTAAAEEARAFSDESRPLLMGVSVLTSLDQATLTDDIGVARTIDDQILTLSRLAIRCELDGIICPAPEVKTARESLGSRPIIVTPGIRMPNQEHNDQRMVGDAQSAFDGGANYIVMGRALTSTEDIVGTLERYGLIAPAHA